SAVSLVDSINSLIWFFLSSLATGGAIIIAQNIGKGDNKKSMSYVGNIVDFILFLIENQQEARGCRVFNYVDKPDLTTRELVSIVGRVLNKRIPSIRIPYWIGMFGGYCFDILSKISGKSLPISSVRVKKFCAVTRFDASKVERTGFKPAFSLEEGLARMLESEFG
ncbi:MAG: hypothetical protein LBE79_12540, partial [Tannerella sp.]|nr:hypothetical protein [Tannerella sp.]